MEVMEVNGGMTAHELRQIRRENRRRKKKPAKKVSKIFGTISFLILLVE